MFFYLDYTPDDNNFEEKSIKPVRNKKEKTSRKIVKVKPDKAVSCKELGMFNSAEKDLSGNEYSDLCKAEISLDDKHKVVVHVKRSEESNADLGLLYADFQHWIDSDVYTGLTKQKIHIPLWKLPELKLVLEDVLQECYDKGLIQKSKDEWKD